MKKKKIIFDVRTLSLKKCGIFYTTLNILKEMCKRNDINLYLYISNREENEIKNKLIKYFPNTSFKIYSNKSLETVYEKIKTEKNRKKAKKQHLRKFILQIVLILLKPVVNALPLLKFLNKFTSDTIYFSPCYKYPEIFKNLKKYTLLHDIIPIVLPEYAAGLSPNSWFAKLLTSLNEKDYYFTDSEHTKRDFLKHFKQIEPNHIVTTLLACNGNFHPASTEDIKRIKEKYNLTDNDKYLFSLCPLDPRKNLMRVIKTFGEFISKNEISNIYFILGGGHWHTWNNLLNQTIESLGENRNKIIKAGTIPDEDLAPLYSGAEWFVYTSQYEGFGLPPLEAMSCGCPVITSNNSSLPEVVGDAGIMIDWDSDEQHIEAYEKYYFNPKLRNEFAQKGLERAKQFSWEKCANQMLEVMLKK